MEEGRGHCLLRYWFAGSVRDGGIWRLLEAFLEALTQARRAYGGHGGISHRLLHNEDNFKILLYEFSIEMAPSLQMVSKRQVNILDLKVFTVWRHHLEALQKASKCLQIDSGRGY